MKIQTVAGLFDDVFSPLFQTRMAKSNGGNGFNSNSEAGLKPRLEPESTKQNSVRKPVRRKYSGLPASLEDWLSCNAALEISRRGHNGTKKEDRTHTWAGTAKTTIDAKNLPAMSLNTQMA